MASEKTFWMSLENFLGCPLSEELKNILNNSGFDNELALSDITSETISDIEKYESRNYDSATPKFSFLPGHRAVLMNIPKKITGFSAWKEKNRTSTTDILESPKVSFIMKEMVKTALSNSDVDIKRRRYSESIKNFGIYLYIMCGKAAYEVISQNLPLPQPSTISEFCKLIINWTS